MTKERRVLNIGDTGEFTKTISESDIYSFAGITGDFNPVHIDRGVAEKSVFGDRIAHGMYIGSLISTVLGMKMPGAGTIYLEQKLTFKKPVFIGDTCTAKAVVSEILNLEKGIYKLDTTIVNQNIEVVSEGYAIVKYF